MSPPTRIAALSGSIAGMAMLGYLMVGASRADLGWDSSLRWILSLLGSEPALISAGEAAGTMSPTTFIVLGLSIHFLTAIALARVFLILTSRLRRSYLPLVGAAYGCAIWAIMAFGLMRVFDEVMYARVRLMPLTFLAAHLVYGTTLAAVYSILRKPVNQ